ncbi:AlkZ family DNA glycosylase [Dactylosporangium aurantiacum]|uniref:AlkZ family DNA glycosylase n=1 Tax=Dactylosporangium aurantiacum TaxID=35754 RepID=A0A9Q9MDL9_9ACTN|nr:winged helix DNA-binding domain-containing protein [Dactylosporangium aurantiacum]MDG6106546.1 winged helix DNA-binding domain-containing protein [Dactylosporangium aurantiacum]UWZ50425.1 AlkZ family DNA glycosylase [Dactylosporangium aurantiacum]
MTPHISDAQRRARLAWRHGLAAPTAGGPEHAAADMVALHATDPATVYLSIAARQPTATVASIDDALYTRRSVLRMLGMRRTMFVVPTGTAGVVHAAAAAAVAAEQRRLLVKHLQQCGAGDAAWLTDVEAATIAALHARGGAATAAQLATDVPRLRTELVFPQGSQYATSRVLLLLAAQGHIVRGRPNGTWTSSQYTWHLLDPWLPAPLPDLDPAAARTDLARLWLARYGPGTVNDLKWWTGWTLTQTRAALAALPTVTVTLDGGGTGVVLADDTDDVPPPPPWAALLPALDPTMMGWATRDWYLGPHAPALFDRTGNPGPTIWADGRVVGGWAHLPGHVTTELLQPVDPATRRAVDTTAEHLTTWIGDIRITPRFRTPLERRLTESVTPRG